MADGWCVYILHCSDDTLYTGISNSLERRLAQHNAGTASKYTRVRRPVEVVFCERQENKGNALRREYQIKKLSRLEKLQLISEYNTEKNSEG